jgi:hypothetical protein
MAFHTSSLSGKVQESTSFGKVTITFTWHIKFWSEPMELQRRHIRVLQAKILDSEGPKISEIHQDKGQARKIVSKLGF